MRSTRRLVGIAASIALFGGVGLTRAAHAGACQIAGSTSFGFSGGVVSCQVTVAGTYDITALGANGGEGDVAGHGGQGAEVGGEFYLAAGLVLDFIIGGGGHAGVDIGAAGGGGGTFVGAEIGGGVLPPSSPAVAAVAATCSQGAAMVLRPTRAAMAMAASATVAAWAEMARATSVAAAAAAT